MVDDLMHGFSDGENIFHAYLPVRAFGFFSAAVDENVRTRHEQNLGRTRRTQGKLYESDPKSAESAAFF
jgi:hypothetical protein